MQPNHMGMRHSYIVHGLNKYEHWTKPNRAKTFGSPNWMNQRRGNYTNANIHFQKANEFQPLIHFVCACFVLYQTKSFVREIYFPDKKHLVILLFWYYGVRYIQWQIKCCHWRHSHSLILYPFFVCTILKLQNGKHCNEGCLFPLSLSLFCIVNQHNEFRLVSVWMSLKDIFVGSTNPQFNWMKLYCMDADSHSLLWAREKKMEPFQSRLKPKQKPHIKSKPTNKQMSKAYSISQNPHRE